MNKVVKLVNDWAKFEEVHPDGEMVDFCRYILIKDREGNNGYTTQDKLDPQDLYSKFSKLVGRIAKIHMNLSLAILKEYNINSFEDFPFLHSIAMLGNPRKTDVITANYIELSSGLLIIDRLKKNGWIIENNNETDKRSKRISLSTKGKKVFKEVQVRMSEFNQQCFGAISDDDISLCMRLMSPIEKTLSTSWTTRKTEK
ncbi:MarR family winged helix-turn-helix transcriptional regulator [Chryseobacterium tongliaoense]|uniref:MarR family winged helix-turn-helix transcriptional regulator n=1 Tax=Chryseobacterium tongliaoense TaxID=3240933 RepID=UPI003513C7D3